MMKYKAKKSSRLAPVVAAFAAQSIEAKVFRFASDVPPKHPVDHPLYIDFKNPRLNVLRVD